MGEIRRVKLITELLNMSQAFVIHIVYDIRQCKQLTLEQERQRIDRWLEIICW